MTQPFLIPDDFRDFMKSVVVYFDSGGELFLDAEDALDAECGYGGRIDGSDTYRFKYITADGVRRWEVVISEAQIRDIAIGILIEVDAEPFEIVRTSRREPVGEPLMIWGEYAEDALHVRNESELLGAIDALHSSSFDRPCMLRVWSAADDQLVAAMWGDRCALYVVESPDGYATSTGDQTLNEAFEVIDHEGHTLTVPLADCVSWDYARRALVRFIEHSDLGDVPVEGRIPSLLLMMGDVDRKVALAARAEAPRELARSSLPRMVTSVPEHVEAAQEVTSPVEVEAPLGPVELSQWARRLIDTLNARELIVFDKGPNLDEISYQLGSLLGTHAIDAEHSLDTAEWLANEIGAVRGVSKLFASGGDLQILITRTRQRPSMS
ncbi:MAG: Imm1 family immunity protein [Kofleriaceae bacterium]